MLATNCVCRAVWSARAVVRAAEVYSRAVNTSWASRGPRVSADRARSQYAWSWSSCTLRRTLIGVLFCVVVACFGRVSRCKAKQQGERASRRPHDPQKDEGGHHDDEDPDKDAVLAVAPGARGAGGVLGGHVGVQVDGGLDQLPVLAVLRSKAGDQQCFELCNDGLDVLAFQHGKEGQGSEELLVDVDHGGKEHQKEAKQASTASRHGRGEGVGEHGEKGVRKGRVNSSRRKMREGVCVSLRVRVCLWVNECARAQEDRESDAWSPPHKHAVGHPHSAHGGVCFVELVRQDHALDGVHVLGCAACGGENIQRKREQQSTGWGVSVTKLSQLSERDKIVQKTPMHTHIHTHGVLDHLEDVVRDMVGVRNIGVLHRLRHAQRNKGMCGWSRDRRGSAQTGRRGNRKGYQSN